MEKLQQGSDHRDLGLKCAEALGLIPVYCMEPLNPVGIDPQLICTYKTVLVQSNRLYADREFQYESSQPLGKESRITGWRDGTGDTLHTMPVQSPATHGLVRTTRSVP